jgi:hypothetical protein
MDEVGLRFATYTSKLRFCQFPRQAGPLIYRGGGLNQGAHPASLESPMKIVALQNQICY